MEYAFLLSKENLEIAREEVLSLIGTNRHSSINNILITEIKNKRMLGNQRFLAQTPLVIKNLSKRLAYTKSIHSLLFESSYKDFLKNMENFEWNRIYKDDFCIRTNSGNVILF